MDGPERKSWVARVDVAKLRKAGRDEVVAIGDAVESTRDVAVLKHALVECYGEG